MIRIIVFIVSFVFISVPAYAGFEFTPPVNAKQQGGSIDKMMPPPLPAPLMPVDQADLGGVPLPPSAPESRTQAGMKSLTIQDGQPEGVLIRRNRPAMNAAPSSQGWAKADAPKQAMEEPVDLQPSAPPSEDVIAAPVDDMMAQPLPEPPMMAVENSDVYIEPQPIEPLQSMQDKSVLDGFGRDVPLALALQQMVPAGYAYAIAPNVNGGVSLSWSGGRSWIEELNQALSSHGYNASVRGRTVLITAPNSIAAFPAVPVQDVTFNNIKPVEEVVATTQEKNIWQAQPGDSLRRILADWSKSAGVTLYWPETSDYVLTKPIRVKGTYAEAVDAVLTSFAGLQTRPMAKLHTNKGAGAPVLSIQES